MPTEATGSTGQVTLVIPAEKTPSLDCSAQAKNCGVNWAEVKRSSANSGKIGTAPEQHEADLIPC
jgi:hypothetical protein